LINSRSFCVGVNSGVGTLTVTKDRGWISWSALIERFAHSFFRIAKVSTS
jgi:hypothetical protein